MWNLHSNDFMVYVDHRKKIIRKQWRCVNSLSKFKRFPLETTKLHRRRFDLWTQHMAKVYKPSQIYSTVLSSQVRAPFLIWTVSDLIFIFVIFANKKIHFYVVPKQCFHILPCLFFLHKASTCGEDRKTDFCNHFWTIICVLVVQIWITCIKCKENAVNDLNIANEPQKNAKLVH